MGRRGVRAGLVVWRAAIRSAVTVVAVTVAVAAVGAGAVASEPEPQTRLAALARLDVPGFEQTATGSVSGADWTSGFPVTVGTALALASADEVVTGASWVHERGSPAATVVITAVEIDRALRADEVDDARTVLARLGEPARLSTGPLDHAVAARVVRSAPGRSDQPTDVVVLTSRHVLVRVSAQGAAADGRTALAVATRVEPALRSMSGYRPVVDDELPDLVGKVFLGVWLVLGFVLLGPGGVITRRRRAARPSVSNWRDPGAQLPRNSR